MLTGEIRNQIDRIWDAFWSGGIANPVDVIEQITYLLFLKRLDEVQELEERKAARLGKAIERRIFPEGKDAKGLPYEDFRWKRLKNAAPAEMYRRMSENTFRFCAHSEMAPLTRITCAMPASLFPNRSSPRPSI